MVIVQVWILYSPHRIMRIGRHLPRGRSAATACGMICSKCCGRRHHGWPHSTRRCVLQHAAQDGASIAQLLEKALISSAEVMKLVYLDSAKQKTSMVHQVR